MSIQEALFPRGKVAGVFPTLTTRGDEAYVEFVEDEEFVEDLETDDDRHELVRARAVTEKARRMIGSSDGS